MIPGPPTIYQSLLAHPRLTKYDLSSLRLAVTGAAPVRAATMISFASLVKMRPFVAAASARPLAFH